MQVCLLTPAPPGATRGNSVTAERWAAILASLGNSVEVAGCYEGQRADLLVALHARRSAASLARYKARDPRAPAVLALTGTDLYPCLSEEDLSTLELADRLVVLQPLALEQLPERLRPRAVVIYQSATPPARKRPQPSSGSFDVAVLSNLRRVKDPLLPARAARRLPAGSPVRLHHAGAVIDERLGRVIAAEARQNPRYDWLGELPRDRAKELLAGSALLVLPSRHEGGANVVSEALAARVPVLGTRIPGTVGILGEDYPGYFPVGDARALAEALERAATDRGFYEELRRRCASLRHLVDPERERKCWRSLLEGLCGRPGAAAAAEA